ncbi:hypothetical protein ACFXDJ_04050 [Streptomyces sp. NPDC059443]|uniref:hypothetical protein n=1 Tax=unclassified Streptomyces TaxID=2593676 RepID=UPI003677E6FF
MGLKTYATTMRGQSQDRPALTLRRTALTAAAGGCALLAVLGGHSATAAQAVTPIRVAAPAQLTCAARTAQGSPVRFSPAVTARARSVRAEGTVTLERCSSPNGSQPALQSGRLTFRGTGTATCTNVRDVHGSATVTWYDGRGRELGTSTLTPRANPGAPLNALVSASITSGMMAGRQVNGRLQPTSDVRSCGTRGLSSTYSRGSLTIS